MNIFYVNFVHFIILVSFEDFRVIDYNSIFNLRELKIKGKIVLVQKSIKIYQIENKDGFTLFDILPNV